MDNDKKNEFQSRRVFFKKAAKKALPILGALLLTQIPLKPFAKEIPVLDCQTGCYGGCRYECLGCSGACLGVCKGCESTCGHDCTFGCKKECGKGCTRSCEDNCNWYCGGKCSDDCTRGCRDSCDGVGRYKSLDI